MLQLVNISKSFQGVKALQDISITFKRGEVHALCGENGAGKSTLVNILAGSIQPDSGRIMYDDTPVKFDHVQSSIQHGIGTVYQESSLADALSVAENIYPVNQPLTRAGLIDYRALYKQSAVFLDELGLGEIKPATIVKHLSTSQKQLVEIARALAKNPTLLILDEPTASITYQDTQKLFLILRKLKQKAVAIIYISHRMAEIMEISDTISVLKDGTYQGTWPKTVMSTGTIVARMVGRALQQAAYGSNARDAVALEARDLCGRGFQHISFKLHAGEVLGIAGLEGSGKTALALALFGDESCRSGKILVKGAALIAKHPADAIASGLAYLPEDRKSAGLFPHLTIAENIIAAKLDGGWFNPGENNNTGNRYIKQLNIRTPGVLQPVQKLSGGNQQKVVLAKWLHTSPDILIVNEPTHGVDVGAKAEIYKDLKLLTAAGKSILLISGELAELMLLSDRIMVMYNGHIQGFLQHDTATEAQITAMASGL